MNPATRIASITLLAAASAGWLLPFYLFLSFLLEGLNKIKLGDAPLQSFPYFPEAQKMLAISLFWLLAVVFFWGWVAAARLIGKPRR